MCSLETLQLLCILLPCTSRHREPLPPPGGGHRSQAALSLQTPSESGDRHVSSALQYPDSQSEHHHPASSLSRADRRS
jgi:hypothetical protein